MDFSRCKFRADPATHAQYIAHRRGLEQRLRLFG